MSEAPDKIWAWYFIPSKQDDVIQGGWSQDPDNRETEYVRADLVKAAREEGRQAGLREAAECADKTSTCILPSGHFLSKRVGDAIRALSPLDQPIFTPPDETGCQECGGENPVWFAPHDLWNRVMGGEDCKDDPGGILCPVCFIRRAEMAGIKDVWTVWTVHPIKDNPPRSKGMTVQEAARVLLADRYGGYGNQAAMQAMWEFVFSEFGRHIVPVSHYDGVFQAALRALSGDSHE